MYVWCEFTYLTLNLFCFASALRFCLMHYILCFCFLKFNLWLSLCSPLSCPDTQEKKKMWTHLKKKKSNNKKKGRWRHWDCSTSTCGFPSSDALIVLPLLYKEASGTPQASTAFRRPAATPITRSQPPAATQIQGSYYLGWNVNSHVNASVTTEETAYRLQPRGSTAGQGLFIGRQKSQTICIYIFFLSTELLTMSILVNLISGTCFLFFLEQINLTWTDCKPHWYLMSLYLVWMAKSMTQWHTHSQK